MLARLHSTEGADLQSPALDIQPEGGDATGVTLPLVRGETVSGILEIEDGTVPAPPTEKLTVRLESGPEYGVPDANQSEGADVDENGRFHVEQVFPGKLRVQVMPMPENAYIKSVRVGNAEAPDGLIDLSRGVSGAEISISMSHNGGQIGGRVLDETGEPLSGSLALVTLAATADEIGEQSFKPIEPGEEFRFQGLRPGKYRLVAIDAREFSDDFARIRAMFLSAPEIDVPEGGRILKDVKVLVMENAGAQQ